jgi:deoxyribonucleoside regulator
VPVKNNKPRRLTEAEKLEQMILVCALVHEQKITREDIAFRLGYKSVMSIGRILKEAEDRGILEKIYKINREHVDQLRIDFISQFGLLDARITPLDAHSDADGLREVIAIEAARYLDKIIPEHKSLAISGGRTLHRTVERLPRKSRPIKIYPMTGLWRDLRIGHIESGALAFLLWLKCLDSTAYWFPIEPIAPKTNREKLLARRANYLKNPEVEKIYNQACKADLALIAVAALRRESTTIRQVKNIGIDYDYLTNDAHAVGIAGGIWFKENGEPALDDDYFLSVPLDSFKKAPNDKRKKAVMIAGGAEKVLPMYVFLKNKLCNVVVTDTHTAKLLLQKDRESKTTQVKDSR